MAKGVNQKKKLLFLLKYLWDNTNEEHPLTMEQIIKHLAENDIKAERKSLYDDFEALREMGYDVILEKRGNKYCYYIGSRDFELAELKLLVDSIQASKFITPSKSMAIIRKLEKLTSVYDARSLERQVFTSRNSVSNPSGNDKVIYTIDEIYRAINGGRKLSFKYYNWDRNKKKVYRHGGQIYIVSPYFLIWDDENYYLVAYDSKDEKIKHYRVDKIDNASLVDEPREGTKLFEKINPANYATERFGMFDAPEYMVNLKVREDMISVIFDRFGRDITIFSSDPGFVKVNVKARVSKQFIGYIMSIGSEVVQVVGPEPVLELIRNYITEISNTYMQ